MNKYIKIFIEIGLFIIFVYYFMIFPYFDNISIDVVSAIIFICFNKFQLLGIDKFNFQYLFMFLLFFHIILYPKISLLSNNTSYLSMSLHKLGKKIQIKRILLDNFKYVGSVYTYLLTATFIMGLFFAITNNFTFETEKLIQIAVYLLKYLSYIYTIISIYQVICIIKEHPYFILQSYFLLIILLFNDLFLNLSLITLSSTIIDEVLGLMINLGFESILIGITVYKFFKTKEIYND